MSYVYVRLAEDSGRFAGAAGFSRLRSCALVISSDYCSAVKGVTHSIKEFAGVCSAKGCSDESFSSSLLISMLMVIVISIYLVVVRISLYCL